MAAADYYSTVQKIYIAFYSRPADPVGQTYWAGVLNDNGGNLAGMIDSFATSSEATDLYAGLGTNAKINAIYNALFGRDGDVAGITFYANEIAAGRMTIGSVGINILFGAQAGVDLDAVTAKVDYCTSFTAAIDTADELVGYEGATAASTARTELATVVDSTTLTTATANIDATLTQIVADSSATTGTTFTLTSSADVINGSSANDTITGNIGTLTSSDEIHGSAGTDTLTVKIDNLTANNTGYSPIIDGVETLTLEARNASATFFMTNVSGVTTLNVKGITNFGLSDLANSATVNVIEGYSANLTLALAANTATAQAVRVNLNDASGTDILIASDSGTTAVDTLTLDAQTNWANGSAMNFSGMEKLVLLGEGNISLNMASAVAGGMSADAFADTTAIDASGMTGALTLRLDSVDINLKGGAGGDTFTMTASLNTNDTIDGGAGSDTINAVLSGGYIRPIVNNVETLNFFVNSAAETADFRDVSGAETLNLLLATGILLDKVKTGMAINVYSSDTTANALTVQFGTAAIASDVTLNLGNGAVGTVLQSAAATASGMGIGTITMSGNSGSLTVKTDSTAKYTAVAFELNDFTAVTLNAASANLGVKGVVDVNTAQTLNLTVGAGKTMTIGDDLSANSVTNFTLDVGQSGTFGLTGASALLNASTGGTVTLNAGASALIDLSGAVLQLSGASTLSLNVGASGLITAQAVVLGQAGATAGSGAVAMSNFNVSAAGDVAIASVGTNTAAAYSAVSLSFNVVMTSTAASVGLSGLALSDVAGGATASEQGVTFNVSGTGAFTLNAAATDSSNITYHINSTALASGSNVVINLSNVNDTGSVASAAFGAHSGSYLGVDGVDNIDMGLGAMTVNGGLGNDVITFSNSAVNIAEMSVNTIGGADTILGAAAGDIILFSGAMTAATGTYLKSAWNTGTATTTAQILTAALSAAATAAGTTAIKQLAIYTSVGDTIIEVLGTTAAVSANTGTFTAGVSGDDIVRIVLSNKDYTAITAAFQVNTTGSGLSITLL